MLQQAFARTKRRAASSITARLQAVQKLLEHANIQRLALKSGPIARRHAEYASQLLGQARTHARTHANTHARTHARTHCAKCQKCKMGPRISEFPKIGKPFHCDGGILLEVLFGGQARCPNVLNQISGKNFSFAWKLNASLFPF